MYELKTKALPAVQPSLLFYAGSSTQFETKRGSRTILPVELTYPMLGKVLLQKLLYFLDTAFPEFLLQFALMLL
jgi:hypothetical protein